MNLSLRDKWFLIFGLAALLSVSLLPERSGGVQSETALSPDQLRADYERESQALKLDVIELQLAQMEDEENADLDSSLLANNWRDRYNEWEKRNRQRLQAQEARKRRLGLHQPTPRSPRRPKPTTEEEWALEQANERLNIYRQLIRANSRSDSEGRRRMAEWELRHPEYNEAILQAWQANEEERSKIVRPVVIKIPDKATSEDLDLLAAQEALIQEHLDVASKVKVRGLEKNNRPKAQPFC